MSEKVLMTNLFKTFGKIPDLINQNIKYLSYYEDKCCFVCNPCDKIIQISNNSTQNTTVNFKKHLRNKVHKSNTISDVELLNKLSSTFSGKIPPIIMMNHHMLSMNGKNYECVRCEKIIVVRYSNSSTEKEFSYHLMSVGHEENIEDYNKTLSVCHDIYGGIPQIVLNNKHFLMVKGKYYMCKICNEYIQVNPSDVEETEKCFEDHLYSYEHRIKSKQINAFSITPELEQVFYELPNYILTNIEYIRINRSNFFCSLCNENIRFNMTDSYETKLHFKQHIFSETHQMKLDSRNDHENGVFMKLHSLFEELTEVVQENLKYLIMNEDNFYCQICDEALFENEIEDQTMENLQLHFESIYHKNMVIAKNDTCNETFEDLIEIFGTIPELIQINLKHINYISGKNFECVLCNKVLQAKFNGDYDDRTYITENNFEKHLNSNFHQYKLTELEDNNLMDSLEEILNIIPQYIMNNYDYLSFGDDGENFKCILCCKEIAIDSGNKSDLITEKTFHNHFLSEGHMEKLKNKANLDMITSTKLELIFNKVPDFIVSNIQHIEVQGNHYLCILCDAKIMRGGTESTDREFHKHLFGARHRSNLDQLEKDHDDAIHQLDQLFWRIPEFMLKNIDFLDTYEDDLFCLLCQEKLFIDEDDLVQTEQSWWCHMNSNRHKFCLRNVYQYQ